MLPTPLDVSFNIAFLSSDLCIHIFSGSVMTTSLGSSFVDFILNKKVFTSIEVVFTIVDYIFPVELIPKVKYM